MSEEVLYDPIVENSMTLMEHLIELRARLIWVVSALFVGTAVSMLFARRVVGIIAEPLENSGNQLQALDPMENIIIFFQVSFVMGAALAMPIIVYQILAFVTPGLYPKEKRTLFAMLPGIIVLFLTGAAFAFFVMLPVAVEFLQSIFGDEIRQDWSVQNYIALITRVVFWVGVAFEMPLAVLFLARIGLITGRQLLGWWRQALVVIAIMAAAITPTPDPVNMTVVMGPLVVLYFLSVGLAYLFYKPRAPRDFSDE